MVPVPVVAQAQALPFHSRTWLVVQVFNRLRWSVPLVPPLDLPEPVRAVAVHGDVIVTAAGADIAVHQPSLPRLFCA